MNNTRNLIWMKCVLLLRVESLDLSLLGKGVEQVSKMYEGNKREAYIRMASQYLDDLVDVSYSRIYYQYSLPLPYQLYLYSCINRLVLHQ